MFKFRLRSAPSAGTLLERRRFAHGLSAGTLLERHLFARGLLALLVVFIGVIMYMGATGSYGPADYAKGINGFAQVLRLAERTDHGADAGAPLPLGAGSGGLPVTLPDTMPRLKAVSEYSTYRITFGVAAEAAGQRRAVCVPRWSTTATVWLDGKELLSSAPGVQSMRDWTRAQFVALPSGLEPGPHTLDIRVRGLAWLAPGLSEVWEGDQALIRQACQILRESKQARGTGALYIMITLGLIALALGLLRRELAEIYLFLLAVVWVVHHLTTNATWTWMDENTWSLLYVLSRPLRGFLFFLFCLRFTGTRRPWPERLLWLSFGAGYAVMVVLPPAGWTLWLAVMGIIVTVSALYFLPILIRFALEKTEVSGYFFCVASVVMVMAVGLDFLRWVGLVPYGGFSFAYFGVYAFGVAMACLLVEKLVLFIRNEAEANALLVKEVERQRIKISADFQTQQAQSQRLAVFEERKRIVRDMHDGLGSQLVSASAMLKMPDSTPALASELIAQALHELRSVLDVLSAEADEDESGDQVSILLGKLRHRFAPIFRSQNMAFIWETVELPDHFLPQYSLRLQLLRLLQEALTNVLKHAEARTVHFRIRVSGNLVVIEIQDDGRGLPDEGKAEGMDTPNMGQGIASMRVRAIHLGATLQIENTFPGTRMRLTFPQEPNVEATTTA